MPDGPINEDLGVTIRIHKKTGIEVYMYKKEPGVYRTKTGSLLKETIAFEAGFPVDELSRQRVMGQRKSEALAAIEEEFSASVEEKVLVSKGGYKAIRVGPATLGRYVIRDPSGEKLNEGFVSQKEARRMISKLVAPDVEGEEEEPAKKSATG